MTTRLLRFRHGTKSYEIVDTLFAIVFPNSIGLVVVDLTYGLGRFYRFVSVLWLLI